MTLLLVSEPTTPSAAAAGLDRFAAELGDHLGRAVTLVEQPLATVDLGACEALLVRAPDLDAALAIAGALAPRTIALEVARTVARRLVERHALAGAITINAFRDWQHGRAGTGRGLWGRLALAPQLNASILERGTTHGLLARPASTLPALVADYLTALTTAPT